ncbi:hypothetical protein [Thermococcus sp. LS2]|uniref:hypothetical protein n=1 Tax=Thermococcus sp. LS2 TaxID=1638260 RepID=UPI0014392AA1|nr:hypothetical protein [Thermococcus sp. LS2]NJE13779.1 hypothetical protein [Thermococcus sp. LS2]
MERGIFPRDLAEELAELDDYKLDFTSTIRRAIGLKIAKTGEIPTIAHDLGLHKVFSIMKDAGLIDEECWGAGTLLAYCENSSVAQLYLIRYAGRIPIEKLTRLARAAYEEYQFSRFAEEYKRAKQEAIECARRILLMDKTIRGMIGTWVVCDIRGYLRFLARKISDKKEDIEAIVRAEMERLAVYAYKELHDPMLACGFAGIPRELARLLQLAVEEEIVREIVEEIADTMEKGGRIKYENVSYVVLGHWSDDWSAYPPPVPPRVVEDVEREDIFNAVLAELLPPISPRMYVEEIGENDTIFITVDSDDLRRLVYLAEKIAGK